MAWFNESFRWSTPALLGGEDQTQVHILTSLHQLEDKVTTFDIEEFDFAGYDISTLRNIFLYFVSLNILKALPQGTLDQTIDFITADTTVEAYLNHINTLSRSTIIHLLKLYYDDNKLPKLLALAVGIVDYDTVGLLSYSEILKLYHAWALVYTNEGRSQIENSILWAQVYLIMGRWLLEDDQDSVLYQLLADLNFADIPDRIQIMVQRSLVSSILNAMTQAIEEEISVENTDPSNRSQTVSMIIGFLGSDHRRDNLSPDESRVIKELSSPQNITQLPVSSEQEDRISLEAISGQYVKCSNSTPHYYNLDSYKNYMRLTDQSKIAYCPTCKSIMLGQVFTT